MITNMNIEKVEDRNAERTEESPDIQKSGCLSNDKHVSANKNIERILIKCKYF